MKFEFCSNFAIWIIIIIIKSYNLDNYGPRPILLDSSLSRTNACGRRLITDLGRFLSFLVPVILLYRFISTVIDKYRCSSSNLFVMSSKRNVTCDMGDTTRVTYSKPFFFGDLTAENCKKTTFEEKTFRK